MKTDQVRDPDFERLLDYLKHSRMVDFTGYKRASLTRRVAQRMQTIGVNTIDSYIDLLQVDQNEYIHLFNNILINVTAFLRDTQSWDYINTVVLPEILSQKTKDEPIRIWSAGVASGEEAYTIAMLLNELLGLEAFKQRVKIYATDIDQEALKQARTACYTAKDLEELPENLREKYFEQMSGHYFFHKELRRTVIFGRHDLIHDAPISRIDLLLCRNILMYFNTETQAQVLTHLHFALREQGFLFLGKAEMLLTHTNLFAAVDLKHRIFTKVARRTVKERRSPIILNRKDTISDNFVYMLSRLREAASDANPIAQIVIDTDNTLILANTQARLLFSLAVSDIGRPIQDLKLSYHPLDLHSLIDQAKINRAPNVLKDLRWHENDNKERFFDVSVATLHNEQNKPIGVSLSFFDVSQQKRFQKQLEHTNQELETAMQELESTNEELETTNEELQSTIEELETSNEELQAANEELETMNEELQATNEELETLNNELSTRTGEINEVNAYLNSILTSLSSSVLVINKDYLLEVWNPKAEELWGLRKEEVLGQSFFSLDIGLPVEQLKQPIRAVLSGEVGHEVFEIGVTNRRGQALRLRGSTTPLFNPRQEIAGVIMIFEQDGVPKD